MRCSAGAVDSLEPACHEHSHIVLACDLDKVRELPQQTNQAHLLLLTFSHRFIAVGSLCDRPNVAVDRSRESGRINGRAGIQRIARHRIVNLLRLYNQSLRRTPEINGRFDVN